MLQHNVLAFISADDGGVHIAAIRLIDKLVKERIFSRHILCHIVERKIIGAHAYQVVHLVTPVDVQALHDAGKLLL